MIEVGRMCVKLAGRDAGQKCVIVEVVDDNYVLIDGLTRRRKCNIKHLEPLKETLELKDKASHEDIITAFKKIDIEIVEKKSRAKTERVKKQKVKKEKPIKTEAKKKEVKKVEKKEENVSEKTKSEEKPKK